jgi:hypothetical protein
MTAGDASQARRQESSSTAPCCWHCRFEELLVRLVLVSRRGSCSGRHCHELMIGNVGQGE